MPWSERRDKRRVARSGLAGAVHGCPPTSAPAQATTALPILSSDTNSRPGCGCPPIPRHAGKRFRFNQMRPRTLRVRNGSSCVLIPFRHQRRPSEVLTGYSKRWSKRPSSRPGMLLPLRASFLDRRQAGQLPALLGRDRPAQDGRLRTPGSAHPAHRHHVGPLDRDLKARPARAGGDGQLGIGLRGAAHAGPPPVGFQAVGHRLGRPRGQEEVA